MSVKGSDNTFDLNPKWARPLPLGFFHGIFIFINALLWDIPYSTNSNVIPAIYVFIGHAFEYNEM
jgi:hypothetical protein